MNLFYFLIITFLPFLNGLDVKANEYIPHPIYIDDEKFISPKTKETRKGAILTCPNGSTKLPPIWNFTNLRGDYTTLFKKYSWKYAFNKNAYNNDLNQDWNIHLAKSKEGLDIAKLDSLSASLFLVPLEKEKPVYDGEEFFFAYQRRLLNGEIKNINNSYKLTNIALLQDSGIKISHYSSDVAVLSFKNRQNKKIKLVSATGYSSSIDGDFWLMNSKKKFYKGLKLENTIYALICEGNNLISRVSNSFRLNFKDEFGTVIRGPLIILLRESSFKLQELPRVYYETPSL